jgi:exonuclease VII small subunit
MYSEIRNQIIAAASVAKLAGFDNTYKALIELIKEIESADLDSTSSFETAASELRSRG